MKSDWNNRWKKALIWLSGYLSFIAFALVGGYVVVKCEDKELRKTAKTAFIATLLFTAIDVLISFFNRINALAGYNRTFSDVLDWIDFIVFLAKIAIYAFAIVVVLFVDNSSAPEKNESAEQTAVEENKEPAEQLAAEENKESAEQLAGEEKESSEQLAEVENKEISSDEETEDN